jgi:hypothetical protein
MGRLHIARGPTADDDPQAWAHRVSIKRMRPSPVIKFSFGMGPRVKTFLLLSNIDFKNHSFKIVDKKNFKYSNGSYLKPKASPNMLF